MLEGKTSHDYQAMYIYVTNKNLHFLVLGAKPLSHYFGSKFF